MTCTLDLCDLYFRQTALKSCCIFSLPDLGSNCHHMFLFPCMLMRLSFHKKVYPGLMKIMFLLLLVMFLFTPNTYKSTTPVTLRLLILERLRILTVLYVTGQKSNSRRQRWSWLLINMYLTQVIKTSILVPGRSNKHNILTGEKKKKWIQVVIFAFCCQYSRV